MAMTGLQQAFDLLNFEGDFRLIQPWWDVLANFALDFTLMLSLTAVTTNLFGGNLNDIYFTI